MRKIVELCVCLSSSNYHDDVNCCHSHKCKKVKANHSEGEFPGFIRVGHKQLRDTNGVYTVISKKISFYKYLKYFKQKPLILNII